MHELDFQDIACPYCGETINVALDTSIPSQEYIEDCQVCCRPIIFTVAAVTEHEAQVSVRTEDE